MRKSKARDTVSPVSTEQPHAATEPLSAGEARRAPDFESPGPEAAALDKVRDLLFGEQVRETGDRLRDLEERFFDETRRIDREISERMENMGRNLDTKLDELRHQLAATEGLVQENKGKASEQLEALRDELGQRMAEERRALDGRISEHHERAIAHIDQAAGALGEAKMGRDALAEFLSEMASRVGGK